MDGINYSIKEIKERVIQTPFPHVILPNFFGGRLYHGLVNEFKITLSNNDFHALGAYDATGHVISENTFGGNLFYSKQWFDFVSQIFDSNLNGKTDASFHHHKIGSKSGWIHDDFNLVYIKDAPNADGISPWRKDTDYWKGSCGTAPSKRAMTFMYFLNNESWENGDNGELGFYNNSEYNSLFTKVPPINNSALFFKCCSNSWHAYIGDNKKERNSAIQFFLADEKSS